MRKTVMSAYFRVRVAAHLKVEFKHSLPLEDRGQVPFLLPKSGLEPC